MCLNTKGFEDTKLNNGRPCGQLGIISCQSNISNDGGDNCIVRHLLTFDSELIPAVPYGFINIRHSCSDDQSTLRTPTFFVNIESGYCRGEINGLVQDILHPVPHFFGKNEIKKQMSRGFTILVAQGTH